MTTIKKKVLHMAADDNMPILFNKRAYHGIKTKPGIVVVSQADPHSWILQKYPTSPKESWDPSTIFNFGISLTDNHTNLVWR